MTRCDQENKLVLRMTRTNWLERSLYPDRFDLLFGHPHPLVVVEIPFTKTERCGSYFDIFVVVNPLDRLFKRVDVRGFETDCLVGAARPHIRELFRLANIDDDILIARILSDDHPLVHMCPRRDEKGDTVLKLEHRVRCCDPVFKLNDPAFVSCGEIPLIWFVAVEIVMKDARPLGIRP